MSPIPSEVRSHYSGVPLPLPCLRLLVPQTQRGPTGPHTLSVNISPTLLLQWAPTWARLGDGPLQGWPPPQSGLTPHCRGLGVPMSHLSPDTRVCCVTVCLHPASPPPSTHQWQQQRAALPALPAPWLGPLACPAHWLLHQAWLWAPWGKRKRRAGRFGNTDAAGPLLPLTRLLQLSKTLTPLGCKE